MYITATKIALQVSLLDQYDVSEVGGRESGTKPLGFRVT